MAYIFALLASGLLLQYRYAQKVYLHFSQRLLDSLAKVGSGLMAGGFGVAEFTPTCGLVP